MGQGANDAKRDRLEVGGESLPCHPSRSSLPSPIRVPCGQPNSPAHPVMLVGAGPGDPGLITVRGREALEAADVVVYDRLANPRLLQHAPPTAERIYVGKQPGDRTWRQAQINALLIDRARAGQIVCRLKGGDPFVYGRGGEEALALAEAGIPFEVVPGVTSAIAAPAYAGIPVTYRGLCAALGVIAGQQDDSIADCGLRIAELPDGPPQSAIPERLRFAELAGGLDTLVFLMSVENLPQIVEGLLAGGRPAETPIALVRWGTWSCQETLVGTLATIIDQVREANFQAPAVTVVGEVVRLREKIRWFDNRPLFGRRILVTRAREQASELSRRLEAQGAEAVEFPLIRLEPIEEAEWTPGERLPDWVLFASANAVACFWRLLERAGRDWRALGHARVAAVGPATARALAEHHVHADFIPSQYEAAQILAQFPADVAGRRVLLPRAEEAPDGLPDGFRAAGASVEVLPVYRNVLDGEGAAEVQNQLDAGKLDAVTFTASSTVRNFKRLLPSCDLRRTVVVCIGPSTAATARELGYPVSVVPSEHTIPGLVDALVDVLRQ
jgi:uroporphyrinogen III methyltransferase/synthase